nr:isochorismatase [Candidatus Sigynarchaeota archaeon]
MVKPQVNLNLHARYRKILKPLEKQLEWDPVKTIILVVDVWNEHWCKGANERLAMLLPTMDRTIKAARAKSVTILHAPSETMEYYKDFPQRQRMQVEPVVAIRKADRKGKMFSLRKDLFWPIAVSSDGGCNDTPKCHQHRAWTSQHGAIEIFPDDLISDNGAEIYSYFKNHDIENVIVLGVHTNMCIMGRSFGIRKLVAWQLNVVLCRDLTDTMYNPASWPHVPHERGTELVVEHIERHWCPSISSSDITRSP